MLRKLRVKLMKMLVKDKRYGNYIYWMKMVFELVSYIDLGKLFFR